MRRNVRVSNCIGILGFVHSAENLHGSQPVIFVESLNGFKDRIPAKAPESHYNRR